MERTRVKSAGKVAFGEVEKQRDACRSGSDEEGREGGRRVIVYFKGRSGSANGSKSERDQENADSDRYDAFDSTEMGAKRCAGKGKASH